ncbi:GNAT family N-acetyltransferase [Kitasatospora sp. NPDC101801]|uniref:GNAT family N-acetyltransferase n=1 Tax=Kitasatospora sp. NPDC101801 TaxID=3364103 RepID=UPI0038005297
MSMSTMAAPHRLTLAATGPVPEIVYRSVQHAPSRLTEGLAPASVYAVTAETADGRLVGRLLWDHHDGMVWWVGVEREHRRHGIATAMWQIAHRKADTAGWTRPVHSTFLLHDGRAWIASL